MDSRASTRTRLSVLPVFIALIFNLMAPVVSIAVPEDAPGPLSAPEAAIAVSDIDPAHVNFTLEGCKDPSVNLELTNFVCADGDYTTGNLGKSWNELDLVPHRLTTSLGSQAAATTTYDLAIVADNMDGGAPGYDIISVPVINEALSDESCEVEATGGAVGDTVSPGIGGTDTSLYRILTITQDKGTTCVFDYYERLALGSHLFPGSSLHSNLTNKDLGTQGVGARDVSIPVKEIEPQELDKDMTATQGQAYEWTVEKSADPGSLHFANTCLDTDGARSAQVEITVEWTRSGPTASGDTMITTNIYATNPAHRTIQVNVTDKIYEGAGQTVLLDTANSGPVNVPAFSDEVLVLTHQFTYDGDATSFNDVATATYTDLVTGIPVPGQTTASASATTTASGGAIENASVLVTDTESISGTGLTFSVAEPTDGEFTNYTAGDSTVGPVNWQYTADESGSVTFLKTVTVDEPRIITNGSLSDTATIVGDNQMVLDSDMESVDITADAEVSLTINKTIPAGALRSGESVTFDFDVTGPNGFEDAAQITFNFGGSTTGSVTLTDLDPGEYTVSEEPKAGWAPQGDLSTSIDLPECTGSVSFTNTELEPDLNLTKVADAGSVSAGDPIGFQIVVSNDGEGTAKDVELSDPLPFGPGIDWTLDSVTGTGGFVATGTCEITGDPTDDAIGQDLDCDFGDLAPGQGVEIEISSDTDASSCAEYFNEATVNASNHAELTAGDTTEVLCGAIEVDKTPDDGSVNAPGTAEFTIVTTNSGTGEARGATLFDDLPEVSGGWTLGAYDWAICAISSDLIDVDDDSVADDIGQWLSCGPETIAAVGGDNTRTVTVSASVTTDDCGPLDNLAEVTTSNDGSDEDAGLITVLCPELGIDKDTSTPEVNAGDPVDYTITVSNDGDGPANDVVITDVLPDGITWSETSDDCEIADGTLTCGPMTIAANSGFSVTVTGTTDAGECPSIENSARFTSSNAGSGSTSETPTEIIVNCPDLELDKTGSSVVVAGDTVFYTITVTNHGEGDAHEVVLTDDLPNIVTGGWDVSSTTGIPAEDCDVASNTLTCEIAVLPSGASFSVTVETPTAASECPSLTNDASVSASNEATDEETQADNTDSHTITVNCPDTSIEKEAGEPVNAGDLATFTITVTAGGSGTNENVTLSDQLHGSALDWSFEVSGDGANEDCSIDAEAFLLCAFGDLEPEDSVTVVLTYQTNPDDCPSIANSASVSATNDVDLSDNESDEVSVNVNCPDVTVDKEPVESPISAGEQGQFTLVVSNDGPGVAYDVEVVDTAPDGTVWSVLNSGGFDCSDEVTDGQQTLTCTLDEMAAGASATILIAYTTSQDDCGVLDNDVAVSAGNEPDENTENNTDSASIVVECPGLNLVKTADADPIDAGEEASFAITLWNTGPGDALGVTLHDDLPAGLSWDFEVVSGDATDEDCGLASSLTEGGVQQMSMDCDFGTVGVTDMAGGIVIRVFADTDRADCGTLVNTASADGSNLDEPLTAGASIEVRCPEITLDKENDAVGSVLPGTSVTYTLTLTVDDGPANDVMVVDSLPVGLENPTSISDGGEPSDDGTSITWDLGDLADGEYTLTYQATVADGVENGEELVNAAAATSTNSQCPDLETLGPECEDDSTVIVRVPTLVIDKVADAELITITGEAGDLEASPSIVTWTLTYTLANGPVTNAVITDEIPAGFVFLDASDGGLLVDGAVTWTFATLSESGSVTFRTTVDPETISRVAPTVNVAVIDSDETEPDDGQDSVTVEVEAPPLGGNPTPTPKPELPDTAAGIGLNGETVSVPLELLVALFVGSLGALTLANVKARSRRR